MAKMQRRSAKNRTALQTIEKPKRCYIYTRVSTVMQVDGYSLESQLKECTNKASEMGYEVVKVYSDEGKSGKSTEKRPEFKQMLLDIWQNKDNVSYVFCYSLSRFGRNAGDANKNLAIMQRCGCNLFMVDKNMDTGDVMGKTIFALLSAVAQMERENISAQTMQGRREKAAQGKSNGAAAPLGYRRCGDTYEIVEEEAEIVREVFNMYINTNLGFGGIATRLKDLGIVKPKKYNRFGVEIKQTPYFSVSYIGDIIGNPIYMGKIAYGRRTHQIKEMSEEEKQKRIQTMTFEELYYSDPETSIIEQDEFDVYEGKHEAIVTEDVWIRADEKRAANAIKCTSGRKTKQKRFNILSGLLRCPICGGQMYGNVSIKHNSDGSIKEIREYYYCKRRSQPDGHERCTYKKNMPMKKVDQQVEAIIVALVNQPRFETLLQEKLGRAINTEKQEAELKGYEAQLRKVRTAKTARYEDLNALEPGSRFYSVNRQDLMDQIYLLNEDIVRLEEIVDKLKKDVESMKSERLSADSVYGILKEFGKIYSIFTPEEKQTFMKALIESVEIYPDFQEDGRIVKKIKFNVGLNVNGKDAKEIDEYCLETNGHVETVVLLSKGAIDSHKVRVEFPLDGLDTASLRGKATNEQIQAYVEEKTGFKVSSLYISQIKRKCGLEVGESFNKSKSDDARVPACPPEKETAILEALKHFGMI